MHNMIKRSRCWMVVACVLLALCCPVLAADVIGNQFTAVIDGQDYTVEFFQGPFGCGSDCECGSLVLTGPENTTLELDFIYIDGLIDSYADDVLDPDGHVYHIWWVLGQEKLYFAGLTKPLGFARH